VSTPFWAHAQQTELGEQSENVVYKLLFRLVHV